MSDPTQRTDRPPGAPPSGPQAMPRRTSRTGWLFGIGVLIVAAGAAFYWYEHSGSAASTPEASAAMSPPQVTDATPLKHDVVEWDEYTGQFSAIDYVEVRARVSGYI